MGISTFPAASAGGVTEKVFRYTNAGTDTTFTLPNGYGVGNPLMAEVTILGGGGSGGIGNYSATDNWAVGGGGGAGGFFQGIVPITENMTVRVGRGGPFREVTGTNNEQCYGGNGGASYIGTGTIKNMFINPTFYGASGSAGSGDGTKVAPPFTVWTFNTDTGIGTPIVGSHTLRIAGSNWTSGGQGFGQPYPIKPSINYCFSIYLRTSSSTNNGRLMIDWHTSEGVLISSVNGTAGNFSTGFTRFSVTGTAPSNAAYLTPRIYGISGSDISYASSPMLEENATTPGNYVDGSTTNYKWVGTPFGSPTILASDTMYIVNGGGGGSGRNSVTNTEQMAAGFAGACSGGGSVRIVSNWSSYVSIGVFGGNGGGLGGNATTPMFALNSTTAANQQNISSARNSQFADFSLGSNAFAMHASSNNTYFAAGVPGPANSFGYGKGGAGPVIANWNNANDIGVPNNTNLSAMVNSYKTARPNSGDGGVSTTLGYTNTTSDKTHIGGPGGSGLVIIKYWS